MTTSSLKSGKNSVLCAKTLKQSVRASGSTGVKSRTYRLPLSLQEDDVTSGGPQWIPRILGTNCVCFCAREKIGQPCGRRLQPSPVSWLPRCWPAAAYKCCWPLKMISRRASATLTVSPNQSHIMTPALPPKVPAFSSAINGFTCTDMLLMRALWLC